MLFNASSSNVRSFCKRRIVLLLTLAALLLAFVGAAPKDKKTEGGSAEKEKGASSEQSRVCKVDIFYTWIPKGTAEGSEGLKRYYGAVMDEGKDESEVRIRLKAKLIEATAEAFKECKSVHQSNGSCFEMRLRNISLSYSNYDFPRRKILTDAIEQDCSTTSGLCGEVTVSGVECWGDASPDSPTLADFEPVTVATEVVDEIAGVAVEANSQVIAPVADGETVEVKKKQVLKAAPTKVVSEEKKEKDEPEMINSPFVVD